MRKSLSAQVATTVTHGQNKDVVHESCRVITTLLISKPAT